MRSIALVAAFSLASASLPANYPTVVMHGSKGDVNMPLFGIGTWEYNDSVAEAAVTTAFKLGYRHVDTASYYNNSIGIGKALKNSGLAREDFFVTSKLAIGLNITDVAQSLAQNLKDLQLDYVDLMLIHFPATGPDARKAEWLALEKFAKARNARAIGVSHHCRRQLEDVLSVATLPVAVNQVEYHVGMGSAGDRANDYKTWMQSKGILYESFSPLCGPCDPPNNKALISGDLVTSIGKKHGKSGPQIALRWLVQQKIPVIPKSSNPEHLAENMQLFDFKLTTAEMNALTAATVPAVSGGPGPTDSGDCDIEGEIVV